MINVSLFEDSNKNVVGFEVSGHAEYADPGMDIVCSAVSALTITVINSIEEQCDDDFYSDFHQDTGYISLHFHGEPYRGCAMTLFPYREKPSEKHRDGKQVSSLRATTRIEGR